MQQIYLGIYLNKLNPFTLTCHVLPEHFFKIVGFGVLCVFGVRPPVGVINMGDMTQNYDFDVVGQTTHKDNIH